MVVSFRVDVGPQVEIANAPEGMAIGNSFCLTGSLSQGEKYDGRCAEERKKSHDKNP